MNILTDFRTEMSLMTWLEAPESKMKRGSRQAAPQTKIMVPASGYPLDGLALATRPHQTDEPNSLYMPPGT